MMNHKKVSRRDFLKQTAIAAAVAGTPIFIPARARANKSSPNILLVLVDGHSADVAGCYGNGVASTPNLDALASRGTLFESAYCNSPASVPSALSITGGKYISQLSAWGNHSWLPADDYPSLPGALSEAGYDSVLCGSMHYASIRRYGFEEIKDPLLFMNERYKTGRVSRRVAKAPRGGLRSRLMDNRVGEGNPMLEHDEVLVKRAGRWLKKRRANDGPFFMLTGFATPRLPYVLPEKDHARFKGRVPLMNINTLARSKRPVNYRHLNPDIDKNDPKDFTGAKVEDKMRLARELYYGLIENLDTKVGRLLTALDKSRSGKNTVVIYAGSRGATLGENGLWFCSSMYEAAARVPLVISWPARWGGGRKVTGALTLLSVVKTILGLAGAESPEGWSGESLVPVLDDSKKGVRGLAISEYYAHNVLSGITMCRKDKYKYIYHTSAGEGQEPERELYDLAKDRGESNNLVSSNAQSDLVKTMHTVMVKELGEEPDEIEKRCREEITKKYSTRRMRKPSDPSLASLRADKRFPDKPTKSEQLKLFESPYNFGDNYGQRIRGFIHPPADGDYVFWIASDDHGELWLSGDRKEVGKILIAVVSSWTMPREWDKNPEQKSKPVSLKGGQKYYIEALHKDAGGGDGLAVGWQGPGIEKGVIEGKYLSPPKGKKGTILREYWWEVTGKVKKGK